MKTFLLTIITLTLAVSCQSTQNNTFNKTVILGSVSQRSVVETIRSKLSQFRYCVERYTEPGQVRKGRIDLRFIIGPEGKVTKGNVQSDIYGADIKKCSMYVLKRIQFAKPTSGIADVSVPINITLR